MNSVNIILCAFIFAVTAIATSKLEKKLIPILKNNAKQPIYEGGPSWHASKSGTPTMGGIAFVVSISITVCLIGLCFIISGQSPKIATTIFISMFFAIGNALIGFIDDLTKLRKKENAGLTPLQKLFLQFLLSIIFLMARAFLLGDKTAITLPFGEIELGVFYYPLAIILILGIINCANLTDGIDGLATSVAWLIGAVLLTIGLNTSSESALLSSALMGGTFAFLFFNAHPAKIFMGDTGSLFLGAIIITIAFTFNNPFLILLIGGVYVIEGASVILQVLSFRLFKKRILKMAPIHHHLERCGFGETKICIYAIIATLVLSIPTLLFLK